MNRQNDHSFLQPEQLKTMQEKDFGNSSMKDDMSERVEDSPVRFDCIGMTPESTEWVRNAFMA